MVARSPPKQLRRHVVVPNLNLTHVRETVNKVDQCMARLQELQHTVRGGTKAAAGSTTNYYSRKQEPFRMRNTNSRKSPNGKLRTITDEWRRMSLPAMLLGETMGEILQASQLAKKVVEVVSKNKTSSRISPLVDDPKTPVTERRKPKPNLEINSTSLQARRKREKRVALQTIRSEKEAPNLQRAKSKIYFKVSSPVHNRDCEAANGVSQINRPWVKRSVPYRNPLFHSSPTSHGQKFSKTKSPVIARKRQTPHKFLIKSPQPVGTKSHVKLKSPNLSISPTRAGKRSSPKPPTMSNVKLRRSFSPSRLANRLASPFKCRKLAHGNERAMTPHKFLIKSPQRFHVKVKSPPRSMTRTRGSKKSPKAVSTAGKLRRSLSPARLANRLMSPLKSRKLVDQNEVAMKFTSGLKKSSAAFSVKFSPRRI